MLLMLDTQSCTFWLTFNSKTLELQREVDELRRQLALRDQQSITAPTPPNTEVIAQSRSVPIPHGGYMLENVVLSEGEVTALFAEYVNPQKAAKMTTILMN